MTDVPLSPNTHPRRTSPSRTSPSRTRTSRTRTAALVLVTGLAATVGLLLVATAGPAAAVNDLPTIVGNLRNWIMGILAALATLFLTIGGVRYVMAGGDPGEIERAKVAFRSAGVGYVLAAIAPVVLTVLKSIVGS